RQICPHCKTSYTPTDSELAELGISSSAIFYKGAGCVHCFDSGYKGRCAIYELMPITPKIKAKVLKNQDGQELRKSALSEKMKTLFDQGVELVLSGITSSAELLRVTRIDQGGL